MMRNFKDIFIQSSRAVALAAGISAALSLLTLVGPIYGLLLLDQIVARHDTGAIAALSLMATGAIIVIMVLDMARGTVLLRAALWLDHVAGQLLFENAVKGGAREEEIARRSRALSDLRQFLLGRSATAVFDALWSPLLILGVFILHPLMGLIALAGATCVVGITIWNNETATARELGRCAQELRNGFERQVRANAGLVRSLGLGAAASRNWEKFNRTEVARAYSNGRYDLVRQGVGNGVFYTVELAVIGVGAMAVLSGALTVGGVLAGVMATTRVMLGLRHASNQWSDAAAAAAAWKQLRKLERDPIQPFSDLPVGAVAQGYMQLADVSYIHTGRTSTSLSGINLNVASGECLVITGSGGSGKSTLAAMIAGAARPHSGRVTLDGINLNQWQMGDGGGPIGYAPDDPVIFQGSVHQNIVRFCDDTMMSAAHAAMQVYAHEVLSALPDGYGFQAGPAGRFLSLREQRAIGRARAICGEPVIVVFDEPELGMSAHDIELFACALEGLRDNTKIGLVIATNEPRFQRIADRAVVLMDGCIMANGDPYDLLKLDEGPDSANIPWSNLSQTLASFKEPVS